METRKTSVTRDCGTVVYGAEIFWWGEWCPILAIICGQYTPGYGVFIESRTRCTSPSYSDELIAAAAVKDSRWTAATNARTK